MKILTNKEWEFMQEGMRLKYARENAELQLRNAKLKYLEAAFDICVDTMSAEDIEKWCVNYKVEARMKDFAHHFFNGAKSGINALCDSIRDHNLMDNAQLEDIRIGILNKVEEEYEKQTEELAN